MRRPVEGAEKSARGDVGVRCGERAFADAVSDEGADAALVAIPLGDDERSKPAGQGIHFEMCGGALDVVEQAQNVGFRELPDAVRQRTIGAPGFREGCRQFLERPILAEIQQLVLAAEVVIQVRRRQVRGLGDVAHAGCREAARAEHRRRRLQDAETPRIGTA
jgi:hypothetical protein